MENNVERRKSPRVTTHIPVRYRKVKDGIEAQVDASISRDLAQGGVCFKISDFVSMACRLILEMDVPMFNKPIKAITKVSWIRKTKSGNGYEVGNHFLEMSKEDKKIVQDYVDNLEAEEKTS